MKFGDTFNEYLRGEDECFLEKCSHIEYKQLKKVLKRCRANTNTSSSSSTSCGVEHHHHGGGDEDEVEDHTHNGDGPDGGGDGGSSELCTYDDSCSLCDQKFFSELMKEASEIAGCFSSRVRRLLHLHISTGVQRYVLRLRHCFTNDNQIMIQQGRMLIDYVTMNAIAIRKILKKYDKVHSSVNGRNFRSKLRAEHIELLQSPWLIELGAFYINFNGSNGVSGEYVDQFSCDVESDQPVMTLMVSDSVKLEYSLTCAICLEIAFNPYALSCGHIFCKLCACSAASVMVFQGLKAAEPKCKCPVCREVGVYANPIHMIELDLLLKNRRREYWKERMLEERSEMVKQSKEYWDSQTKYVIGY